MQRLLPIFALALLALAGCKKEEPQAWDGGTDYFPLAVGQWAVYKVDSMWRDDLLNIRDSVSYMLKQQVVEEVTDGSGRRVKRIIRYVKDASDNWVPRDVWSGYADQLTAELTEENLRRLKLSFPVREARAWNINVYNAERELEVAFRQVDRAWSTDELSFNKTVLVRNVQPPNPIERRNFEERYARNVGLVAKYWEETNTQYSSSTQQFVTRGFKLNMRIVEFGNE